MAPFSAGTLRTTTPTFVVTLIFVIVLVAALTFLPALALGPDRHRALGEPVLMAAADCAWPVVAAGMIVILTVLLGILYPLAMTGRRPGPVPRLGRRQPGEAGRRGRRLRARGPGLHLAGLLPHAPLGDHAAGQPVGDDLRQPRPRTTSPCRTRCAGTSRDALELERPYTPGLRTKDLPVDMVTTSASGIDPDISAANARLQADPRRRRSAACRPGGCST